MPSLGKPRSVGSKKRPYPSNAGLLMTSSAFVSAVIGPLGAPGSVGLTLAEYGLFPQPDNNIRSAKSTVNIQKRLIMAITITSTLNIFFARKAARQTTAQMRCVVKITARAVIVFHGLSD
jgi:hypothetical protein